MPRGYKKLHCGEHFKLEQVFFEWFMQQCAMGMPMLNEKAELLAHQMANIDFKCSDRWLSKFILQYIISGESSNCRIS